MAKSNVKVKDSGDALEDEFDLSSVAGSEDEQDEQPAQKRQLEPESKSATKPKNKKKIKMAKEKEGEVIEMACFELVDYFFTKLRSANPNSSTLELEKLKLEEDSFVDNSGFKDPHTINHISEYIKFAFSTSERLSQSGSVKASPYMIILTPSAIRATSVVRAVRDVSGKIPVGKLFAKHIKIQEQQAFLSNTSVNIGIGTPNRIIKLIELGSLSLDRLELIVIDMTKDPKSRHFFQIPECLTDFFELYKLYLTSKLQNGETKLAFF